MFDLIDESGQDLKKYGYKTKAMQKYGITKSTLSVLSRLESEKIGLSEGNYCIFISPFVYSLEESHEYLSDLIKKELLSLFKRLKIAKNSKILIVGLGNPDICADSLGKSVFDNVLIDALDKSNNIFKFCPNIFFSTGIDTFEMVKMFAKNLKIDLAIIIDSLSTSNLSRLGTSFQITDSGMTPGSGVNRFGKRICKETIGCACISIGVPFMINSKNLSEDDVELILVCKDVKENVSVAGKIIASALNEVLL